MITVGRARARHALATLALIVVALLALSASAEAAAPANDNFSSPQLLPPTHSAEASGGNVEATKEAGEPSHAGNAGGHSVWFEWTPSAGGPVSIKAYACFSELKPLVAVYTGSAVNSLTPVADNGHPFSSECFFGEPSMAEFEAQAGTTYRIAVDGRNGTVGSFNLRLEGPPANDDFAAAKVVTSESNGFFTNRLASKQPEEPDHAGDPGGHSVWFKWTPPASERVTISTCSTSSALDALLAVYTGSEVGSLTAVASNDDSPRGEGLPCRRTDSEVTFDAVGGTTYWLAVDGSQDTVGGFNLRIQGRPANDDFGSPVPLSSSLPANNSFGTNVDATKQAEEPDHAGNAGGHSVWFSWTPSEDVRVRVSTCSTEASLESLLAVYTGTEVTNLTEVASAGIGSNSECTFGSEATFDATENTKYMIAVDGKDGDEGNFNISIEPPPANDDFANAKSLTGLPASTTGTTLLATKQAGEPNHAGDSGGNSVWYSWTSPVTGPIAISTCSYLEASPDTLLAVYTGSELGHLTEIASNDDSSETCKETDSAVRFQAEENATYWIAVDDKGAQGVFSLQIEAGSPANDSFATPQVLAPFPIAPGGSTVGATKEAGEPNHAGNAGGHSVWFEWTPEDSGPVDLSVCGLAPGVDTLLAVYTGTEVANLTEVAGNDDSGTRAPDGRCEESSGNSEVSFEAKAGTAYRIAVDTKGGEGRFALDLERAPANDDFANATVLEESLPAYGSGNDKLASKQPEEPDHAGDSGGHSLWFKWTPETTESVSVSTCTYKTPLDTLLAVYTGSEVGNLTAVASNDDGQTGKGCRSTDSEAEFTANAGTTYWIAVDGKAGSTGSFQLFLEGAARNDDFGKAQPLGGGLPVNWQFASNRFATKQLNEPDHAGDKGGSSVWFKWTAPRSGTISVDTCGSGFDTLLAVYTGAKLESLTPVASNDDGSSICAPQSRVTFAAVANTVYRIAVDGKGGAQGPLELHLHPVLRLLSVVRAGGGTGSVASNLTGIECGTKCEHDFEDGTVVTLAATPAAGSTFAGWSGGGCSGTGSCQLTLSFDATVTASFEATGGGGGSGGETVPPLPPPPPPPQPKPKPLECKRGYKKKTVHGKPRCVKKKKHRHHHHR